MCGRNTLVCFLGLSLCVSVRAASSVPSGYQSIVERNVFGLNPPKPGGLPTPPVAPPPKLTLTGITTLLGNKRALLTMQVPNKPAENFILTEGQRDGEIEVLQIDEKAGSVKVLNHGIEQTLDFLTAGAKPQPALSPTGYSSTGLPPLTNAVNASTKLHTFPSRSLRLPQIPRNPQSNGVAPVTVP